MLGYRCYGVSMGDLKRPEDAWAGTGDNEVAFLME